MVLSVVIIVQLKIDFLEPIQTTKDFYQSPSYKILNIDNSKNTKILSKYAYVTLLNGIDDSNGQTGYTYNIIIMKKKLDILSPTIDFLLLLGFDEISTFKRNETLSLFKFYNITISIIPRLIKNKRISLEEIQLSKIFLWNLKQYEKILFLDADLFLRHPLDCFFSLPWNTFINGYENIFYKYHNFISFYSFFF